MSNNREFLGSIDVPNTATRGPVPQVYTAYMPQRTWENVKRGPSDDGGKLDAAFSYAVTHTSYTHPPFYFVPLDDDLTTIEYNRWTGTGLEQSHTFLDRWDYRVSWAQVIRTVAS